MTKIIPGLVLWIIFWFFPVSASGYDWQPGISYNIVSNQIDDCYLDIQKESLKYQKLRIRVGLYQNEWIDFRSQFGLSVVPLKSRWGLDLGILDHNDDLKLSGLDFRFNRFQEYRMTFFYGKSPFLWKFLSSDLFLGLNIYDLNHVFKTCPQLIPKIHLLLN